MDYRWIVNIVILFVLRQLARFREEFDWTKAEADLDARVRQLVPGTWFDDEAAAVARAAFEALHGAIAAPDVFGSLLQALAAGRWNDALEGVRRLIDASYSPWPASLAQQRLSDDVVQPRTDADPKSTEKATGEGATA